MEHKRCGWAENGSAQLKTYHDEEWGKPVRGERELFELLILESFIPVYPGRLCCINAKLSAQRWISSIRF